MILFLLLVLFAHASDPQARARQAWEALRLGQAQRALELTEAGWRDHPALAAVHLAASKRVHHPLQTAALCAQVVPRGLQRARVWGPAVGPIFRTCGWTFLDTRTHRALGLRAARSLLDLDPYDNDARGLLAALEDMEELPRRKWEPPPPPGSIKQRRKRDFLYLYRYLRPEDGSAGPDASWTVLPGRAGSQARLGLHSVLHLRDHERVPLGYRVMHTFPGEGASGESVRDTTHQVHGGYDVRVLNKTPLMLDSSLILGEGRDEGIVRFRVERNGLGVWSADSALVWTPWGSHGAVRLGWDVTVEGLAGFDLDVEGQAGTGGPRGLARLGVYRTVGRSVLRVEGQLGQATRPLTPRWLLRDLPGLEGAGASLSLDGPLAKHWSLQGRLEVVRLHLDLGQPGATSGIVSTTLIGRW